MWRIIYAILGFAVIVLILVVVLPISYSEIVARGSAALALGFVVLVYPYFAIRNRRNLKKIERDIKFDRTRLRLKNVRKNSWVWEISGAGWAGLTYRSSPPAWPADLSRIEDLRRYYCREKGSWGSGSKAVVDFEPLQVSGCEVLRVITKEPINHYPVYAGRLVFPFQKLFYEIWVSFMEARTTDLSQTREFIVYGHALNAGEITIENVDGVDLVHGWYRDHCNEQDNDIPVAPFLTKDSWGEIVEQIVSRRSLADDEINDEKFPTHALTKVRGALARIQDSLMLSERLVSQPPFRKNT